MDEQRRLALSARCRFPHIAVEMRRRHSDRRQGDMPKASMRHALRAAKGERFRESR